MRRLNRRQRIEEQVKSLDVFPKVEPEQGIQHTSSTSGLVTLVTSVIIVALLVNEVIEFNTLSIRYEYGVDDDLRRDMNLTLDITIAMNCEYLGADYVDASGSSIDAMQFMKKEAAHFELSPNQLDWVEKWQQVKEEEGSKGLDSLNRFLHGSMREPMPTAAPEIGTPPDACRVFGTMSISKVAANFHVTAGKSIQQKHGHTHVTNMVPLDGNNSITSKSDGFLLFIEFVLFFPLLCKPDLVYSKQALFSSLFHSHTCSIPFLLSKAYNFSHRIDRFSFSEDQRGAMALDGDLKTTTEATHKYQYYLKVVPSTSRRLGETVPFRSNQYSVTEHHVVLQPHHHAIPGLFFRFDIAEIAVHVHEEHMPWYQFVVRLFGLVGGFFAFSKMLSAILTKIQTEWAKE
eukprot:m.54275 g.54275  ORF g.54275 m.54275 type:complete len:402 (+) comp11082_c0_seq1:116-1321(+)